MPLVRFLQYIGLIFLMQMLFSYITGLFELLFNHFGYTLQYSEAMNADYAGSWTLLTYAVLLGPLAEEIVYRGFLMRGLEPCGRRYALIVCSVVFGLMHGDFQQSMFTVFAGLLFGYAAMRYSVWYSLALHIFNNGILGELWIWFIDRAPDTVYITLILIFLVLSAIGTVQLIRKRGRDAVLWLKEEQTRPGAWPALVNLWMILFLAYSVTEIVLSIRPLT